MQTAPAPGVARSRRARLLWLLGAVVLLGPSPGVTEPARNASQTIDALHENLLDVMKNAVDLGYQGRADKLASVIPEFFDIAFMARKSVGRHWKKADEAEQKLFVDAFTRFMIANYAGRFDGFSGQSFETLAEKPARQETVLVETLLINPADENVELNYRMREVAGAWKIVDVYLDGTVSELALRRSEFVSIVKREDFDALILALDEKIAKLAESEES